MSDIRILERTAGIAGKCKHFNGTMHDTCEAGVLYADVAVEHEPISYRYQGDPPGAAYTHSKSLPCLKKYDLIGCTCDKAEYPTAEEVEAAKQERLKSFEQTKTARAAIMAHARENGYVQRLSGARGQIVCPVCNYGTLHYSVDSCNGHVHARCSTDGCLAWME